MSSRAGQVITETVYGQTLALRLGDGDEHCALESDTTGLNVKGNFYLNQLNLEKRKKIQHCLNITLKTATKNNILGNWLV